MATVRPMRIDCPSCGAAYEVPDTALAAGPRLLRCTACGHEFEVRPPALEPPQPGAAKPGAPPPPEPKAPPEPRRPPPASSPRPGSPLPAERPAPPAPDRVALLGWVATLAALGAGGWLAVTEHVAIAEAWPPARHIFQLLGLE